MTSVAIVYASLTGNTKAGAEVLQEAFEDLGAEAELIQTYDADPYDVEDADIVVVGVYTYGVGGQLPDESVDFYEELVEVDWSDKVIGAFGSGDLFYEDLFCVAVDQMEERLLTTGATLGAENVKYNLDPDADAIDQLEKFAAECLETFKNSK